MSKHLKIEFTDRRGPPQNPPNPQYPSGIDINMAPGGARACVTCLPYPAEERGIWRIHCTKCGSYAALTAAGRVDDPRTIRIPCLPRQYRR